MIDNWPILSIVTFLPLAGVLFLLLIKGDETIVAQNSRYVALWVSALPSSCHCHCSSVLIALRLVINLKKSQLAFWFRVLVITWALMAFQCPFVLLSTILTPLSILASWRAITHRVREYMIAFLVLETMMVGMFVSLDMLMFYLFFEAVLIPMFLIIGVWGGQRRVYAAFKFFLFTLFGSVLMLVCMLAMYVDAGTTDIPALTTHQFAGSMQKWLFLGFLASFAVKVPMWPVHTWLPDAHVEAPTAGSMILAGVLLKMGGYGFLRFSLPMFPLASEFFAPLIFTLSIIAVIYTSLVALAQSDMKKMIAYSSVAHMGFVTIGIFTMTEQGIAGAMFQMVSHGLVSAALFFGVGVVYDRLHTREISAYGGVATVMPRYAVFFMFMMLASVGLPGTSGFVGEILVLIGAWHASSWVAFFTATGLVLGATYMLWLYRRVMFGVIVNDEVKAMEQMEVREYSIFLPLSALVLLFGVYPMVLLM